MARTLFPHLFRLEGEGRESVASLIENARMFLGSPRTIYCQVTDSFSSMKSLVNSPYTKSLLTLLSHISLISWLIVFLMAFFALGISFLIADDTSNVFSDVGIKNKSSSTHFTIMFSHATTVDDFQDH